MPTIYEIHDQREWDDHIKNNGGHPLQLWGWGEVKSGFDWHARRYVIQDGATFLAAAQVLIRKLPFPFRALAYVPRGPVVAEGADHTAVLNALVAELKHSEKGLISVSIEPDEESWPEISTWKTTDQEILPSETIRIHLTHDEQHLMSAMTKKMRQYIRKSEREVQEIRVGSRDDLTACFEIYRDTASRAGFALRTDEYYLRVWDQMGEANHLYLALQDGKPVAFLWNALSDAVAFELYGGMNHTGQQLRANYALKWHAILDAKRAGSTIYDMGGLIEGGVSTFKRGWTAEESKLIGTLDYSLSPLYSVWHTLLPLAKKILKR